MQKHSPSSTSAKNDDSAPEPPPYYTWVRHDILAHIPGNARHVLSVGCGAGATEAMLVEAGVAVVGIERNPAAGAAARKRGLTVLEGDVCEMLGDIPGEPFDCLIYADLLEHLTDPVAVLRRHVPKLRPGGTVIISVPNFRHYSVCWQLFVRGEIRYTDAGVLDRTHVRMTTRRMAERWVREVGLAPRSHHWHISQRRWKLISACLLGLAREWIATQVILVAEKACDTSNVHSIERTPRL